MGTQAPKQRRGYLPIEELLVWRTQINEGRLFLSVASCCYKKEGMFDGCKRPFFTVRPTERERIQMPDNLLHQEGLASRCSMVKL